MSENMVTKAISKLIHKFAPTIVLKAGRKDSARTDEALNDLSYEDALLDVEIRSFMRTEYGKKMPPNGVFPRIIQAIRLHREEQAKTATVDLASSLARIAGSLGQALLAACKFGVRLDAGRMISGSLITGLVLLAVWPGMAHWLSNGGQLKQYIDVLSGGVSSAPIVYPADTRTIESPTSTSALSAVPTPVPVVSIGPVASIEKQRTNISPGRLYDDPRLLLAQRTGEDPNELKKHSSKQATDGGTGNNGSNQGQPETNHNRPTIGQD
jgi:hypothetical protein